MILETIMFLVEIIWGRGLSGWQLQIKEPYTTWKLGAKFYPSIYCQYQVFRYITPVVLHAGLWHFAMNMWFSYSIMLRREVYWGMLRTILMYVASGVGGTIMSLAIYPADFSVGASGALCGIYGGFIVDAVRMWKKMSTSMGVSYAVNILVFVGLMIIIGFLIPGIDNGAHLGGLLTGIFLGMIILQKKLLVRVIGGVLLVLSWFLPTLLLFVVDPITNCAEWREFFQIWNSEV